MEENIIKISEPEIRIKCEIIRTKAYTEFSLAKEKTLYMYLISWAIRGKRYTGNFKLYENFYLNGLIPTRWSQNKLAEHFKVSQSTISKWINNLKNRGLIKIIKKSIYGKQCNIYIIGTVKYPKRKKNRKEILFFDSVFSKLVKEERLTSLLSPESLLNEATTFAG